MESDLKRRYRYIRFEQAAGVWYCVANSGDDILGQLSWHRDWREWEIEPAPGSVFSWECLRDMSDFLQQLNRRTRSGSRAVADQLR